MELESVYRDADDYEQQYLNLDEVRMGYYVAGHVDKADFLAAVFASDPDLLVDTDHFGWVPRYYASEHSFRHFTPHRPTVTDVVHTYWSGRKSFRRGRPGKRGAYPVTYLAIEAGGGVTELTDIPSGDNGWQDGLTERATLTATGPSASRPLR